MIFPGKGHPGWLSYDPLFALLNELAFHFLEPDRFFTILPLRYLPFYPAINTRGEVLLLKMDE